MNTYFIVIGIAFTVLSGLLYYYWQKIPSFEPDDSSNFDVLPFVSIVIAFRNEEKTLNTLLKNLYQQTYPKSKFELILIDDDSEDNSLKVISEFRSQYSMEIKLIKAKDSNCTGKKQALALGIKAAKGDWILTTDADCSVKNRWIEAFMTFQQQSQATFIFGGVSFYNEESWFEKMQTIEFASLTGSGAASLQAGFPNMCNGANLAYKKDVYEAVSGFLGNEHLASGDDEFLMHKFFLRNPVEINFLKSYEALVLTGAKKNWEEFKNQRARWASKWTAYQMSYIKWLAAFVFWGNLNFMLWLVSCFLGFTDWKSLTMIYTAKCFVDGLFIISVLNHYRKPFLPFIFVLTALFYPFYVSFFAFSSNKARYEWKGRSLGN